ncbi:hypothetical protein [Bacillus thuringiensis]|uniref:hypothetical protein n=1 Tax=Bacillus thuringiensis TaxID=1428 RepID=UPI0021B1BAAD|nr:hypothetical protein [Bacillus thuringiensis]
MLSEIKLELKEIKEQMEKMQTKLDTLEQQNQVNNKGTERRIMLKEEDKIHLFTYYKTIPEPIRPRYHSTDPLLVAFDFKRGAYFGYSTSSST